jgi:hypothetical protein
VNKRFNLQYCTSDFVLNKIYTEPLLMQYTISLVYSASNISAGSYTGTMTQQTKPQPKFHNAVGQGLMEHTTTGNSIFVLLILSQIISV